MEATSPSTTKVTLKQALLKRLWAFAILIAALTWFAYDWHNRGIFNGFFLMLWLFIRQAEQIYSEVSGRKWLLRIPYAGQLMFGFLFIVLLAFAIWSMRT